MTQLAALGFEFVILVVGGTMFGAWIDTKIGLSAPVGVVVGALLGLVLALRVVLTALNRSEEES